MLACSWGPIRPITAPGSRKPEIILRDKALPAGSLQLGAELDGLLPRAVRANHGAILGFPISQIHPLDHGRTGTEHGRILALHHAERLPGRGLAILRGHRDQKTAPTFGSCSRRSLRR